MPVLPPVQWREASRALNGARNVIEPLYNKAIRENLTASDQASILSAAAKFCEVWLGPVFVCDNPGDEQSNNMEEYAAFLLATPTASANSADVETGFNVNALVLLHATKLLTSMTAIAPNAAA